MRDAIEYWSVVTVRAIATRLPDSFVRAWGTVLGLMFYGLDRAHRREPLARPALESPVAIHGVVRLAGLVVLAADDQELAPARLVQAHVVVRVAGVPVKPLADGAGLHARGDGIGHVGSLLRVDRDAVVDGRVGRDDGILTAQRVRCLRRIARPLRLSLQRGLQGTSADERLLGPGSAKQASHPDLRMARPWRG